MTLDSIRNSCDVYVLHGGYKEEHLEGGVPLQVKVFGVAIAKQPATLGARLLLCEELERGDDNGDSVDEDEDEEVHLLVALQAGEGLVLALGGSRKPASRILEV